MKYITTIQWALSLTDRYIGNSIHWGKEILLLGY